MEARVLLTGGTGFVGINIAQSLVERGCQVVICSKRPMLKEAADALGENVVWMQGDVLNRERLDEIRIIREDTENIIDLAKSWKRANYKRKTQSLPFWYIRSSSVKTAVPKSSGTYSKTTGALPCRFFFIVLLFDRLCHKQLIR